MREFRNALFIIGIVILVFYVLGYYVSGNDWQWFELSHVIDFNKG